MITKQDFKAMTSEEQMKLVNDELLKHNGTKDFGLDEFDFSYSFARNILINAGYDSFSHDNNGVRVKLFRKLTDEELAEKNKEIESVSEVVVEEEKPSSTQPRVVQLAVDIREHEKDEEIVRKTFPAFESTWSEFEDLLKTEDFKIYEKKYVYDLVLRTFLEKYSATNQ